MAGAPRTASRQIASATCSGVRQSSQTSWSGSRVWSSSSSEPCCQRMGENGGSAVSGGASLIVTPEFIPRQLSLPLLKEEVPLSPYGRGVQDHRASAEIHDPRPHGPRGTFLLQQGHRK